MVNLYFIALESDNEVPSSSYSSFDDYDNYCNDDDDDDESSIASKLMHKYTS